jgi:hypothetical protein
MTNASWRKGCVQFVLLTILNRTTCCRGETCEKAIGPLIIGGTEVTGGTSGSTIDVNIVRLFQCGDGQLFDIETPGSWYFVEGIAGGRLRASTCSEATNFKHRITLFSGENCDSRSCLASGIDPDVDCPYTDASDTNNATYIEWDSAPGQNVYILVHNFYAGDSGDFGLTVKDVTQPPENDLCGGAVDVNMDQFLAGSTAGSTFDIGVKCDRCIDSGPNNPGVWYRIPAQGIDTGFAATICSEFLSFNVSIYTGVCDEVECVDSMQELGLTCNSADMATSSTWTADKGQEYYMLVHATKKNGDLETATAPFAILLSRSESKGGGDGAEGGGEDGNGSGSSASSLAVGSLSGAFAAYLALVILFYG